MYNWKILRLEGRIREKSKLDQRHQRFFEDSKDDVILRRSSIIISRLCARDMYALFRIENRPPFTSQGDLASKKCPGGR